MTHASNPALSRILMIDAATCAAMAAVLILAGGPLAAVTGLPVELLFAAGLLLFAVALYMALVSRIGTGSSTLVWLAILGNAAWVAASLALFAVVTPTALGVAFVLVQAAAVALLAWLEASAWAGGARVAA